MELAQLTKGSTVFYRTPSAQGKMEVKRKFKDPNNSNWVEGMDHDKGYKVKVRPGQIFAKKPR